MNTQIKNLLKAMPCPGLVNICGRFICVHYFIDMDLLRLMKVVCKVQNSTLNWGFRVDQTPGHIRFMFPEK